MAGPKKTLRKTAAEREFRLGLAYKMRRTSRAFARGAEQYLQEFGIGIAAFRFMRQLWKQEGRTQKELSDLVDIKGPTAVSIMNRMERMGLLTRYRDENDRRKFEIYLTERGRQLEGPMKQRADEFMCEVLGQLEEDEVRELDRILDKLIEAFDAAAEPTRTTRRARAAAR